MVNGGLLLISLMFLPCLPLLFHDLGVAMMKNVYLFTLRIYSVYN